MAIIRSDSRLEQHPKPTQAYERKLLAGVYVDWPNTTEINAAYNIAYRPNKYFWINGAYFQCENDGVTYRLVSAPGATVQWFTIGYASLTFDTGITETITLIIRGPSGAPEIITDDLPTGTQILNAGGVLYVESGNDWFPGEQIAVLYGATAAATPAGEIITPQELTPGATPAWDYSLGSSANITPNQTFAPVFTNSVSGNFFTLRIEQAGAFDITLPAGDLFNDSISRTGQTINLDHSPGKIIILTAFQYGTVRNWNLGGYS